MCLCKRVLIEKARKNILTGESCKCSAVNKTNLISLEIEAVTDEECLESGEKYCNDCDYSAEDGERFCPHCGERLYGDDTFDPDYIIDCYYRELQEKVGDKVDFFVDGTENENGGDVFEFIIDIKNKQGRLRSFNETKEKYKKICEFLNENGFYVDSSCGGHINVNVKDLNRKELIEFIKLIENKIENEPEFFGRNFNQYCQNTKTIFNKYDYQDKIIELKKSISKSKKTINSFKKVYLTYEKRQNVLYTKLYNLKQNYRKLAKTIKNFKILKELKYKAQANSSENILFVSKFNKIIKLRKKIIEIEEEIKFMKNKKDCITNILLEKKYLKQDIKELVKYKRLYKNNKMDINTTKKFSAINTEHIKTQGRLEIRLFSGTLDYKIIEKRFNEILLLKLQAMENVMLENKKVA